MSMAKDLRGTLVIISPNEKLVARIPVSFFLGLMLTILVFFSVLGLVLLREPLYHAGVRLIDLRTKNSLITANIDAVTEEIRELSRINSLFLSELEQTISTINPLSVQTSNQPQLNQGVADGASFFGITGHSARIQQEVRQLTNIFRSATPSIDQTTQTLEAQRRLLRQLPTHWPVIGGRFGLTMEFGPRIHPFTGQWYIHKGADIAGPPGTPIIAAADGVVVRSEIDNRSGYGNVVIIEHAFGFSTLYAHLRERRVVVGQRVQQGQLIGTMGATGIATGVHLHYEIRIGEEVMDPTTYLAIRNNFFRWETMGN